MAIRISCGQCRQSYTVEDKYAGKKGKCQSCGAVLSIPAAARTGGRETDDLYGLDESAPAPGLDRTSGGTVVPRPRRPGAKVSKSRDRLVIFGLSGPMLWILPAIGAAVLFVGLIVPALRIVACLAVIVFGLAISYAGGDQLRAAMERESPMARWIPILAFLYMFQNRHRPDVRKAWMGILLSSGLTLTGLAVLIYSIAQPRLAPAAGGFLGAINQVNKQRAHISARPKDADPITLALYDLKSPDWFTRRSAAKKLAEIAPEDTRRAEVGEALAPHFRDPKDEARVAAMEAGVAWGVDGALDAAIEAAPTYDGNDVNALVDLLAASDDPRAAEALVAAMLGESAIAASAPVALKKMGPTAEPALLAALPRLHDSELAGALLILNEVGTSASVPVVREVASDPDREFLANQTLEALKARGIDTDAP